MCAHPPDSEDADLVCDLHLKPVVVAFDVENYDVVGEMTRRRLTWIIHQREKIRRFAHHPVTLRVPPLLEKEGNVFPASHEAVWRRRRRGGVVWCAAAIIPSPS